VVLELYAGGNIILLDHDFVILSLLRTHSYDESVRVAVKQVRLPFYRVNLLHCLRPMRTTPCSHPVSACMLYAVCCMLYAVCCMLYAV
jgi:hypothetical protein